jgi:S-formylglutathione hydrolase FrmB
LSSQDQPPVISAALRDDQGFLFHSVESAFQAGTTTIRVLLPDPIDVKRRLPVIYVLPVAARNDARYGDGLAEIKKLGLHNKHEVIFVAPTFSHLPWYADHPTDPTIRQETYFLRVVVPFVERTYPAQSDQHGRLLLGFSKSGWGAWALLLRHPNHFGRAAAWDAPLMLDAPGKYGSGPIFATPQSFAKYHVSALLQSRGRSLGPSPRLILTGYGNFRHEHEQVHALLEQLKIPHVYRDGPQRKHDWNSGWLPESIDLLLNPTDPRARNK